MTKTLASRLAIVLIAASPALARAQELKIGDPAPKIEVKEFVKGEPVKAFEKGKVYVVEFWATWCGPCKTSIPHLTELQKKYKDIKFIGVSVSEQDQDAVKPFVKEMGDKMDYAVALDDVSGGGEGKMSKNWMAAAEQNGIPAAFIVNGEGKIVWIGHPMNMDKVLAKVADGSFDIKAAIAEAKEEKAREQKMMLLQQRLIAAQQRGPDALLKAMDEIMADEPSLAPMLGLQKYMLLVRKGTDIDKIVETGKKLVEDTFKDNADALNNVAWLIVDPAAGKRDPKLVESRSESCQAR